MTTAELEASVEEFFEDYIDTANKSWKSKKALKKRRTMFADSCRDCLAGYRFAKLAHKDNLTISGEDTTLLDVKVTGISPHRAAALTTHDSPAGKLTNSNGRVIQKFDEYNGIQTRYQLRRSNGTWQITKGEAL